MSIEDSIFKWNAPGRWSSHEGERDDIRSEEEGSTESGAGYRDGADVGEGGSNRREGGFIGSRVERQQQQQERERESSRGVGVIPDSVVREIEYERSHKAQTGPKGVLADYEASQAMKSAQAQADLAARGRALTLIAEGARRPAVACATTSGAFPLESLNGDEDDDDDEDDEEGFFAEFRRRRMEAMMTSSTATATATTSLTESRSSIGLDPHNTAAVIAANASGIVVECSLDSFSEVVESARFAVMHTYDPSISACTRMNAHLDAIVGNESLSGVVFCRMAVNVTDGGVQSLSLDRVGLPALSVYKDGECVAALAGLSREEELGSLFSKEDVVFLVEGEIRQHSEDR
jgi:hypothetical protein